jgi:transposase InsO family protein
VTLELIADAVTAGARESRACAVVGISRRTLERWKATPDDRRRGPRSAPANRLTDDERAAVLRVCNAPEYRDLSPNQIVPLLADKGIYIASERTIYRVLHAEGQMKHRSRARPRSVRKPKEHVAYAPNQVWSWDITYLRSTVRGAFFYLYLVVDIYSRKIVGWEVHEDERADLSAELLEHACAAEGVMPGALALHADNGGPMKASTMLATLQRLGVAASFSRPGVSDDNPYSEALFRTLKYHRAFPTKPFADLASARRWVAGFVAWYNHEHLHSALRFVTPEARHRGLDKAILAARRAVYLAAQALAPERWSRDTRNWSRVGPVRLNPAKAA